MADLTGKRVGARNRVSELRAALGKVADTTAVHQITLTGPLALTVPTDFPAGQVYRVTLTQDGTGGHTVTFAGSPLAIDGAAIEDGDKLLTLSMCCTLYGKNETGDQRLVVAAKLLPTAAEEAPYAVQDAKFPELPENK